jgi:hypothetical protein
MCFRDRIQRQDQENLSYLMLSINMKQARPWILANLKIIWQFHTHPVHQKVSRNPCVIKVILLACFTYIDIFKFIKSILTRIFVSTRKLSFKISQGTTVRLNETRFGPKKKLSPIYLGTRNLDTFWCTGWAWNCQIIFRFAKLPRLKIKHH